MVLFLVKLVDRLEKVGVKFGALCLVPILQPLFEFEQDEGQDSAYYCDCHVDHNQRQQLLRNKIVAVRDPNYLNSYLTKVTVVLI